MGEAGLSALDAGGDFADGVIAYEGGVVGQEVPALRTSVKTLRLEKDYIGNAPQPLWLPPEPATNYCVIGESVSRRLLK